MKKLSDSERLGIAMSLLAEHEDIDEYNRLCSELEHDCERYGFHDVPAECEGSECGDCMLVDYDRRAVDCPYTE